MGITLCQYRARVGGYYRIAFKLSTGSPFYNNINYLLSFMIVLNFGSHGLPLALLIFFCVNHLNLSKFTYLSTYLKDVSLQRQNLSFLNADKRKWIINICHSLSKILIKIVLFTLLMLSGDIHPNPGPSQDNAKLSIVHNNICSLENKIAFIKAELGHFDILTISETCLNSQTSNEKVLIDGFSSPVKT